MAGSINLEFNLVKSLDNIFLSLNHLTTFQILQHILKLSWFTITENQMF